MSGHTDPQDYGDFDHFDVRSEDDGLVVVCAECGATVLDTDDPASLADMVKAASRHELEMDRPAPDHQHVWRQRSSMGDPYRVCRRCGKVEDVDLPPQSRYGD